MTAEQMIRVWAAKRLEIPVEQVREVTFEHEDGYGNDSGTWWPESNGAVVQTWGHGERYIRSDGFEDIPDLLAEILEANA